MIEICHEMKRTHGSKLRNKVFSEKVGNRENLGKSHIKTSSTLKSIALCGILIL